MPYNQRNKRILADAEYHNQQNTDRKPGHHICIDHRHLIHRRNRRRYRFLRIKCTDCPQSSKNRCKKGRCQRKNHRSQNHLYQLRRRKKRHIIMQGEPPYRTDIRRVREAVHHQHKNRQIQKQKDEDDKQALPDFLYHNNIPPRVFSSSIPRVSSVNRQTIPRRINAIMEPPCQLYAAK